MVILIQPIFWLLLAGLCLPQALVAQVLTDPNQVTFFAKDYSFHGPASIPGGWQTIRLMNQGRDFHQVQFLKLPPGKTSADFEQALKAKNFRQIPPWVHRYGGVNSVPPGSEARAILNLVPGEYVLICGIPDIEGRAHVVHGMISSVSVTPPPTSSPPPPHADIIIRGGDFSFVVEGPLTPGPHIIQFRNDGAQAHEILVLKLQPWASTQSFLKTYRPGGTPNPTGETIGGVVGLDPGLESYFPLDLEPGRYGLLCFLRDPATGAPHFTLGMWFDFEVQPDGDARP